MSIDASMYASPSTHNTYVITAKKKKHKPRQSEKQTW